MAGNGYNNGYDNNGRNNRNNHGPQRQLNEQKPQWNGNAPTKFEAEELPSDFVDKAENVIQRIKNKSEDNEGEKKKTEPISTNKIRNLLSIVSDIYNVESIRNEKIMLEESIQGITMFRIRVTYEAGRDEATRIFVKESKILNYAKAIGKDRQKLIDFSHYMEALVAYHRYYLGRKEG